MGPLVYLVVAGAIALLLLILDACKPRTGLPGPKGVPFLGVGLLLAFKPLRDVIPWVQEQINTYGKVFEMNIAGTKNVLITDPLDAEILLSHTCYNEKGYEYFVFKPWLRDGLLLSEGPKWYHRRKLLTPTFHFKILEDSSIRLAASAERFVKRFLESKGEPLEIDSIIGATTLEAICETALGIDTTEANKERSEYVSAIRSLTLAVTERYLTFWLHMDLVFKLSSLGKSFFKNLSTTSTFSEKIIQNRKAEYIERRENTEGSVKKRFAFLDRLLEIHAEQPEQLSLNDIQEEVDTFTFEGHDTTAAALKFTLFLLANHQDAQEKAAKEQFKIFGTDSREPKMNDLHDMKYLEMVIKESLRIYPSVPSFIRRLSKKLTLTSGKVIPPGYNVMVWPYFVHRNEDYWDNPEEFRPERFGQDETRHPFCFLPFSAGPRNCIGQKFAMMEMKIMLSSLLRKCRLEPVTKSVTLLMNVIATNEKPIRVKVFPR